MRKFMEQDEFENLLGKNKNTLSFIVGKDENNNKFIYEDLSKIKNILLAGKTGTSTESFMLLMLSMFISNNSAEEIKMMLIDDYCYELLPLKDFSYTINNEVYKKHDEVIKSLETITDEISNRKELFDKLNVENLEEYNNKSKTKLPKIIIAVNEFLNFKNDEKFYNLIYTILNSSKYGIFSIVKTHRAMILIDNKLKNCFNKTLYFNLYDDESQYMLWNNIAADIKIDELLYKNQNINIIKLTVPVLLS